MRKLLLIIAVLFALPLLGGCGGGSSTESAASTHQPFTIPVGKEPIRYEGELHPGADGLIGSEPKPIIPDSPPPDNMALSDVIQGIGAVASTGGKLTIQYVGYDYETEKKFVSSWDQGRPFTFTLGAGEVIPGWEEGLVGLEVGDRREMVIPPDLTRGPYPPDIPEGKTVVFLVELLPPKQGGKGENSVSSGAAAGATPTAGLAKPKVKPPQGPPPKQLVIKDLKPGSGPTAKPGDEVTMHYVGLIYKGGRQFDSSWDRGRPYTFKLGQGEVIKGVDQGIEGMKVGGRREIIIPPDLGYGSKQVQTIPANSTLVFVVDLLAVN